MRVQIWDLPTRMFHWTLVGTVGFCGLSGFVLPNDWFGWHFLAGYLLGFLLVFRLVWGVFGPEHSRWRSFWPTPSAVIGHLKALLAKRPPHTLGHNPAGAAMIFALIAVLIGLVATGLVVLGGMLKQGPLASLVPFAVGAPLKELHELLAIAVLGMVAVHVAGVLIEGKLQKAKLIASMIDGLQDAPADQPLPQPRRRGAYAILVLSLLIVGFAATHLAARPPLGWRTLSAPPEYSKECGACHMAYHPSFLPAASWHGLMADLEHHFGEDASLPPTTATALSTWLESNSAETWDTEVANRLRKVSESDPGRMTATPWWKRRHRELPDVLFTQKSIRARSNCTACHQDAAVGLFAPQKIHIPNP